MLGVFLGTDGLIEPREYSGYDSLREAVNGQYIERVRPVGLNGEYVFVVDEEGLFNKQEFNPVASYLYGTHRHGSPIVGNAVILKETMTNRGLDFAGLEPAEAKQVTHDMRNIAELIEKATRRGSFDSDNEPI